MALDTKKFLTRTASATVFVAVLLCCVWLHWISFVLFFNAVALVGHYEFYKLAEKKTAVKGKWWGYFLHVLLFFLLFGLSQPGWAVKKWVLVVAGLAAGLFLMTELFGSAKNVFRIPPVLMALLYVSVPCFILMLMASLRWEDKYYLDFIPQRVLGMIFFIWVNDTGAYLVGSFIGKNKMFERISPGKTWEGTLGGVLICLGLSFVMVKIFPQLGLGDWMAVSALVAVFGTIGDLVESMFKRLAGVKDSGQIMPGHGGVLDRFDSLIFAAPFVFAYLALTGKL
jgi:phosphatidate cytidylyltransferase